MFALHFPDIFAAHFFVFKSIEFNFYLPSSNAIAFSKNYVVLSILKKKIIFNNKWYIISYCNPKTNENKFGNYVRPLLVSYFYALSHFKRHASVTDLINKRLLLWESLSVLFRTIKELNVRCASNP